MSLASDFGWAVRQTKRTARHPGGVGEWLNPPDCKSGRFAYTGSNPVPSTICLWVVRDWTKVLIGAAQAATCRALKRV